MCQNINDVAAKRFPCGLLRAANRKLYSLSAAAVLHNPTLILQFACPKALHDHHVAVGVDCHAVEQITRYACWSRARR